MRNVFKLSLLALLLVLLAGCQEKFDPNYQGYRYGLRYFNLTGNVKSYTVKSNGQVARYYYSPEGLLVRMVNYVGNDSVTTTYTYDENGRIVNVSSPNVVDYSFQFLEGKLVGETLYTNSDKTEGVQFKYTLDENGRLTHRTKKDLASGEETQTYFTYDSNGKRKEIKTVNPNGRYSIEYCDTLGNVVSEWRYRESGKLRGRDSMLLTYDDVGNWTRSKTIGGKVINKEYRYYSTVVAESTTANTDGVSKVIPAEEEPILAQRQASEPNDLMLGVIGILSILVAIAFLVIINEKWGLFSNVGGEVLDNGMKRMWMFNRQPYAKLSIFVGALVAAFITTIILLVAFGALVYGLFWLIKILLYVLIFLGYVLLIGGVLVLVFARSCWGLPAAILGGLIVWQSDAIKGWAENFAVWGETFFYTLNISSWAFETLSLYGAIVVFVVLGIIIVFLGIALLLMLFSLILRGVEFAVMKIYRVNRPCPSCGATEDISYFVGNQPWPVMLAPGIYGLFHQTNHVTGDSLPTMMFNGKGRISRKCGSCGHVFNVGNDDLVGTDIHIGVVGNRSSGKSSMLYTALEELSHKFGEGFKQVDSDKNTKISLMASRIAQGNAVQTLDKDRYKAIQVMLAQKNRPVPFHLFFYDIAGEKFDSFSQSDHSAVEFYQNVSEIIFVIDPTTIDISCVAPSDDFAQWAEKHCVDSEKHDVEGVLSALITILEQVGRKMKSVNITLTCTKKDLGYLSALGYSESPSQEELAHFVSYDLGLQNMMGVVERFRSVTYAAVSATDKDKSALVDLYMEILRRQGV